MGDGTDLSEWDPGTEFDGDDPDNFMYDGEDDYEGRWMLPDRIRLEPVPTAEDLKRSLGELNSKLVETQTRRTLAREAVDTRWRCLQTGCNPTLDEAGAALHKTHTGHRVAKWPKRSAEGARRQAERNRSGYHSKYNVGDKSLRSAQARIAGAHRSSAPGPSLQNKSEPLAAGEDGEDYWGDSVGR